MWFENGDSKVTNKVIPVRQPDRNGVVTTRWVAVQEYDQRCHFYQLLRSTPTVRQRDRRLVRGGLKIMEARRDAFVALMQDEEPSQYDASEHMKDAFRDRDFELMSVYEKFITKENKKDLLYVVDNCVAALRAMGQMNVDKELTEEHFKTFNTISAAVGTVSIPPLFDTPGAYFASGLLWIAFNDLKLAPKLAEFVEATGITDLRAILQRLPEISSTHVAVMNGML